MQAVTRAFHEHNYVRFFRLARQAPFIQACTLHEHFTGMRLAALHVISRAYLPKSKRGPFKLADISELLGFGDEDDAMNFLDHYQISFDDTNVSSMRFCNNCSLFPRRSSILRISRPSM